MTQRTIALGDVSLAMREQGRGEPMVLVHANLSDLRSWEPVAPLLAADFRVISYSRRFAHPNTPIDAGSDDALPRHADDLIALIEALGLGKVHLVGNSSGAFIALLVAARRPDLVRTLTLEEPPVVSMFLRRLPPTLAEVLKLLRTSPATLLALARFGAGTIGPATEAFRKGQDGAALDLFARGVLGPMAYAKVSTSRRLQMADNLKPHRAALLGSGLPVFTPADAAAVRVPTQLVRGRETPAFQRRINQRLAACIPGAIDVCIPQASHFVHEDNPRAVAEAIRAFCRRQALRMP